MRADSAPSIVWDAALPQGAVHERWQSFGQAGVRGGEVGSGGVLCHSVLMTVERLNGQVRLMLMNGHYRPETGDGKRQGDRERETKTERKRREWERRP